MFTWLLTQGCCVVSLVRTMEAVLQQTKRRGGGRRSWIPSPSPHPTTDKEHHPPPLCPGAERCLWGRASPCPDPGPLQGHRTPKDTSLGAMFQWIFSMRILGTQWTRKDVALLNFLLCVDRSCTCNISKDEHFGMLDGAHALWHTRLARILRVPRKTQQNSDTGTRPTGIGDGATTVNWVWRGHSFQLRDLEWCVKHACEGDGICGTNWCRSHRTRCECCTANTRTVLAALSKNIWISTTNLKGCCMHALARSKLQEQFLSLNFQNCWASSRCLDVIEGTSFIVPWEERHFLHWARMDCPLQITCQPVRPNLDPHPTPASPKSSPFRFFWIHQNLHMRFLWTVWKYH